MKEELSIPASKRRMLALLAALLVGLAVLFGLGVTPARADTTFEVDRADDDASATACTTAANDCSLRGAVIAANTTSGADVINVPAGTYTLNIAGGNEVDATKGALGIMEDLTINGEGANSTTVAGGAGLSDRLFYNGSAASTLISGLTITGGSADIGGAILNLGTLTVSNSTISGNSAVEASFGGGDGGGIYNFGTLTVKQSTISDNEADFGGGVYANGDVPDTNDRTTITNSTISGNSASISGGGVFSDNGITEIEHSTITTNEAPIGQGAGVKDLGDSTDLDFLRTYVLASIISGNIDTANEVNIPPGPQNTFESEGYNLIDDGDIATGGDDPTDAFNQTGDRTGVSDPGLEPLSLNAPGSTKTHALKESSSALNAGPPSTVTECQSPATDQRGVKRPQGGACDIGSFESEVADTEAPAAPTLDLASASDTGSSTTDDKTKDDTPTFEGYAEAGSTVKVYDGTTLLGSVPADGDPDPNNSANKAWSYTVGGTGSEQGITTLSEDTHTITANATDTSDNTSEAPDPSLTVLIDTTAPTVSFSQSFDASHYFGDVPSAPTCSAADGTNGSGVDGSCTVSGYQTTVGNHTLTTNAVKDVAGNEAQPLSLSYEVKPWTIKGYYEPVDMPGTLNTANSAKAGSTVPLKFEVFKGQTELTDTSANVLKAFTQKITCPASGTLDAIEKYSSGKTVLRYDTTAGQYVYNWKTPKAPGSCYEVTMTTKDGSKITANFKLK